MACVIDFVLCPRYQLDKPCPVKPEAHFMDHVVNICPKVNSYLKPDYPKFPSRIKAFTELYADRTWCGFDRNNSVCNNEDCPFRHSYEEECEDYNANFGHMRFCRKMHKLDVCPIKRNPTKPNILWYNWVRSEMYCNTHIVQAEILHTKIESIFSGKYEQKEGVEKENAAPEFTSTYKFKFNLKENMSKMFKEVDPRKIKKARVYYHTIVPSRESLLKQ